MKKVTLLFSLFLLAFISKSQNGLDSVWVEIYYVSDANDSVGNDNAFAGVLPVGSVTYRLWAFMQPGYKLQAAYGVDILPTGSSPGDHQLLLTTSTTFYNNEDYGTYQPCGISENNLKKHSVMIDSWFSMGCNGGGKVSVPKFADTDGALANSNVPPMLQNTDPFAGIPINMQDGMIAGVQPSVTFVGLGTVAPHELPAFDNVSQSTDTFETTNGSIAVLGGVMGPDSANNMVLIGQFTTDGTFCYKLNLQIGTPTGGVENYVAESAVGNEIVLPSLMNCLSYPTGISQHESSTAALSFSVYPNPANNFITLAFSQKNTKTSYALFDIRGQVVLSRELGSVSQGNTERIDLSSFAPGIYFLRLNADGVSSYKKIVRN